MSQYWGICLEYRQSRKRTVLTKYKTKSIEIQGDESMIKLVTRTKINTIRGKQHNPESLYHVSNKVQYTI